MGSFSNLNKETTNTHLLYTRSNLSEIYVYDILKAKCKAGIDSVYEINSKKSVIEMYELVNMQSFLSDKWLFVIDYKKVKSVFKEKIGIFESDTSEFLIKVDNYKDFKEVKGYLRNVNDMYLAFAKYPDIEYLLKDYKIPEKLISFIAKSYSGDIEQIFVLINELKTGRIIEKRKQIVDICGVSSGSVTSFALSLLGNPPSEKGAKRVCKNRISVGVELAETYGFSKMRNFLVASVKDILDIKMLYLNGVIYDRIANIPEIKVIDSKGEANIVYDEKRLARNKMYLNTIRDIPYDRIARLYLRIKEQGRWYNDIDMINFIYSYYEDYRRE